MNGKSIKFIKCQFKFEHDGKTYMVVGTGVRMNHQFDVYENEKLIGQHCPLRGLLSVAHAKNAIEKVIKFNTINPKDNGK